MTLVRPVRPVHYVSLLLVAVAVAAGALDRVTGNLTWALIAVLAILLALPGLADGLIVLLHHAGLIDDEAAGRLGVLHGLGVFAMPLVAAAILVPGPIGLFVLPALLLGIFGFDVFISIAYRLGLTKRRSLTQRRSENRLRRRTNVLEDPGRAAIESGVIASMKALRATERPRYSGLDSVLRLLQVLTLPFLALAVIGGFIAVGGYDGSPLVAIGLVGGAFGVLAGLALGPGRDRP